MCECLADGRDKLELHSSRTTHMLSSILKSLTPVSTRLESSTSSIAGRFQLFVISLPLPHSVLAKHGVVPSSPRADPTPFAQQQQGHRNHPPQPTHTSDTCILQ